MSLGINQALAHIDYAYGTMLAPYFDDPEFRDSGRDNLRVVLTERIDAGASVAQALSYVVQIIGATLAALSQKLPISEHQWSDVLYGYDYLATLDASAFVEVVYPAANAVDKAVLVNAVASGHLSHAAFLQGYLSAAQSETTPSAETLIAAIMNADALALELPKTHFAFADLGEAQVSFLVGIYVAAFNRAPEFEGLQYWAGKLAAYQAQGLADVDAYKAVTRDVYWAGEQNGETGTELGNSDYVAFVYDTVIGRDPDPQGHHYWVRELDTENIPRSEFLAVFLSSALENPQDGAFALARIAVAKFAARDTVSGPGAPTVDLVGILENVHDVVTAIAAISLLGSTAPRPASAAPEPLQSFVLPEDLYPSHPTALEELALPEAPSDPYAHLDHQTYENTLELIGSPTGAVDLENPG